MSGPEDDALNASENTDAPDSLIDRDSSIKYWNSISPDVNGMLGGYPQISRIDLRGSANFIAKLRRLSSTSPRSESRQARLPLAVDCGAGIGRITEGFLVKAFDTVDIVEPVAKFADKIKEKKENGLKEVGDIFITGLESWLPSKKYNLIWNQWCLGHLTDIQVVDYMRRCSEALAEGGWIAVKENLSTDAFAEDIYDEVDSSVTRSDKKFLDLFEEADLKLVRGEIQTGFPKALGLYPVKMYALRPK
ncbi:hypothetical protein UCRPC4_g05198 [Phaeomoniella chlamydospora]|uniref:Alpha N-terminal protein methyltransferase 1 n=1 Tax=Phaeomoniella chlamydospora TaxID=158046 RepID=A0A0G2GMB0_PHACM|nr:hypothetical protein UCRPC4_g05198 [Phaeomoniella chlamydospora]